MAMRRIRLILKSPASSYCTVYLPASISRKKKNGRRVEGRRQAREGIRFLAQEHVVFPRRIFFFSTAPFVESPIEMIPRSEL